MDRVATASKMCSRCAQHKQLDDFYRSHASPDGRVAACRECVTALARQSRASDPERFRRYGREWAQAHPGYAKKYAKTGEHKGRPPKPPVTKACPTCGQQFGGGNRFCSPACVRHGILATIACARCGADKQVRHHLRTALCARCAKDDSHARERQRQAAQRKRPRPLTICSACGRTRESQHQCPCEHRRPVSRLALRDCQWCGNAFRFRPKATSPGLYCAWQCYVASVKGAAKCWSNTEKARLRRKGTRADPDRERVIPKVVFERDGWRCHICRKKLGKPSGPLGQRPSLDHVVPLSKGGKHTYANCRAAHQSCNSGKSNKKPGQPLLIG